MPASNIRIMNNPTINTYSLLILNSTVDTIVELQKSMRQISFFWTKRFATRHRKTREQERSGTDMALQISASCQTVQ